MKYIRSLMILAALLGYFRTSAAQTVTQSQTVTLKAAKTPVVVATPERPAERVTQKVATKPHSGAAVAQPDVLVRPATPKVVAKPQPPQAAPMPMAPVGGELHQKQ